MSEYIAENNKDAIKLEVYNVPYDVQESINILRGSIQLNPTPLKVIAITSSLPNEGKSVVAFNLARSMAKLDKKVLYLDSDIRNSVTMERYSIQYNDSLIGLTDLLLERCSVHDIVYPTSEPNLYMVFAGNKVDNPSEILSNALYRRFITYARDCYDYIIVDTAPVNLVVDATLTAVYCDTTVLVVESGVTEKDTILHAKKKLESANIDILGVVLNKIGSKKTGTYGYGKYGYGKYGHGYGYGYGYGYGHEGNGKGKKKHSR